MQYYHYLPVKVMQYLLNLNELCMNLVAIYKLAYTLIIWQQNHGRCKAKHM